MTTAPHDVVLPAAVVNAAASVCTCHGYVDGLRAQWPVLAYSVVADKTLGQQSLVNYSRDELEKGNNRLLALKEWIGDELRSSALYLPYWAASVEEDPSLKDEERQQIVMAALESDLKALSRMLGNVERKRERLAGAAATKRERLFPKTLAETLLDLNYQFTLPAPSLSDFGAEVKLMAAIAEALGVQLNQEAARKALTKAIQARRTGKK